MGRLRSNDHANKAANKDNIEEVMNEVSNELGVDLNTKSINEDPKALAKRIERSIKKRT